MRVNFVCRASKARKTGLSPIELSIIINDKRAIITLDRQIPHTKFNSKSQSVKGDKAINEYLDTIKKKCYHIENELLKLDKLDIDTFVHSFKYGIPKREDTLLAIYDKHNDLYKENYLCGKVNETAYYKYVVNRNRVADYIKTLGKNDIKVKDITPSFCEGFQCFCLKSLRNNTSNKELKRLKRILEFAVKEGYLSVNPFRLMLKEEKLDYNVLSKNDIDHLLNITFEQPRLTQIRDIFVFQCYTGLSYSDLTTLTKDDIVDDVITKRRQKTDVQYVIPVLPIAKEILEKYNYTLPTISNQKYNQWLKVLGELSGLKKNLHSHLARHSFACLLLNGGVDMKTISRTLGHSSMKITEKIYATMNNDTVVNNVRRAFI